jgi:hypothetical protein
VKKLAEGYMIFEGPGAQHASGRLLVFAKALGPADKRPVAAVNMDQIDTHATCRPQ